MVFVTMWVQSFFSYHRKEHGTPLRVCPAVTLLRTGGKDLRLSAAYPKDYGREVARLHVEAMASWINKFVGNWREPFHLYLGLILVTGLMYRNKNWLISLTKSYENIMVWYSISQEASSGYLAPVLLSPEADGLQNLDLHGIVQGGFKEPLDSSEKEFMPDLVVIHGEVTMYICIWSTWNQLILPKKKLALHVTNRSKTLQPNRLQELPPERNWDHGDFGSLLELVSYAGRHGGYRPDPDVPLQIACCPAAFERLRARLEERWLVGIYIGLTP